MQTNDMAVDEFMTGEWCDDCGPKWACRCGGNPYALLTAPITPIDLFMFEQPIKPTSYLYAVGKPIWTVDNVVLAYTVAHNNETIVDVFDVSLVDPERIGVTEYSKVRFEDIGYNRMDHCVLRCTPALGDHDMRCIVPFTWRDRQTVPIQSYDGRYDCLRPAGLSTGSDTGKNLEVRAGYRIEGWSGSVYISEFITLQARDKMLACGGIKSVGKRIYSFTPQYVNRLRQEQNYNSWLDEL